MLSAFWGYCAWQRCGIMTDEIFLSTEAALETEFRLRELKIWTVSVS